MDDLLARARFHLLRSGMAQAKRLAKQGHRVAESGRRLGLNERPEFFRDGVDAVSPQRHGHPLGGTHGVDG